MGRSLFIDMWDSEVSAYIFAYKGGKFELEDSRKHPVTGENEFPLELPDGEIENVYLSLPVSHLNFRVLDLPFSSKERIREVLPFELDGLILGGSDKVVVDDIVVGQSDDTHQVLAVYIEKSSIRKILEQLKAKNLDPVFITSLELRNPVRNFHLSHLLSPAMPEEKDRIALAMEEMKSPTINLRRKEFAYTRDIERTRKSLRITAILLVLILLIICGNIIFQILSARYEIVSLKTAMRKDYQEIFPQEKNIMNELYQLKSHLKELKDRETIFIGTRPLDLLLKLSQTDRGNAVFHEITIDREHMTMKGEASSLSDVQAVKEKLGQLFNDVNITDSKASAQGKMLFTITAKEKRS